jgi:hypothetical protein
MKKLLVICLVIGLFASAKSFAIPITKDVTYNSVTYTMTPVQGTYYELEDRIKATPFWNDGSAEQYFAGQVSTTWGPLNGYVNGSNRYTYFTSGTYEFLDSGINYSWDSGDGMATQNSYTVSRNTSAYYAVVYDPALDAVPDTGTTILFLGSSLVLLTGVRRKFIKK